MADTVPLTVIVCLAIVVKCKVRTTANVFQTLLNIYHLRRTVFPTGVSNVMILLSAAILVLCAMVARIPIIFSDNVHNRPLGASTRMDSPHHQAHPPLRSAEQVYIYICYLKHFVPLHFDLNVSFLFIFDPSSQALWQQSSPAEDPLADPAAVLPLVHRPIILRWEVRL